jgi:hypothetical protein
MVAAMHGATHVVLLDDERELVGTQTDSSAHASTIGCGPRDFICLGTYASGSSTTTAIRRPRAVFVAVYVNPDNWNELPKELRPLDLFPQTLLPRLFPKFRRRCSHPISAWMPRSNHVGLA